jgi:hypothetical protein
MKKCFNLALLACMLLGSYTASAQTKALDTIKAHVTAKIDSIKKKWDIGGLFSVTFSQANFLNWSAGGQDALGLTSLVSFHANYSSGKFKWLNDVELGYGFQRIADQPFQKTTDQIAITTNPGYRVFDSTLAGLLVNFQSQFAPGYLLPNDSILISKFFAPAFVVIAAGLTWKPTKALSVFLSPATARLTFVEDQGLADQGAFGVKPAVYDSLGNKIQNGKTELTQFGAYFKGDYCKEIWKNIKLTTDLELFSNYLKDPQNIVVNWTTFIQLKVNKFISATLNTQLIYDNNVEIPVFKDIAGVNTVVGKGPRLQFKDIFGVGLAYKF